MVWGLSHVVPLGHATVAFTLDTYSHVVPGLQEAAAERFDQLLQDTLRQKEFTTTN